MNVKGYDLIDPITDLKIQVKVARKAETNIAGIEVKFQNGLDVLAIFWLNKDRKVQKFFKISKDEVKKIEEKN